MATGIRFSLDEQDVDIDIRGPTAGVHLKF